MLKCQDCGAELERKRKRCADCAYTRNLEQARSAAKRRTAARKAIKRNCEDCGVDISGANRQRVRCHPCARKFSQKRTDARRREERAEIQRRERACSSCGESIAGTHGGTKYCRPCYREVAKQTQRDSHRRYREDVPLYRFRTTREGAKKRGLQFDLTIEDFDVLLSDACHYCGVDETLGLDRVDSSVGYVLGNVVPCCWFCNRAKSDLPVEDFLKKCQQIVDKNRI